MHSSNMLGEYSAVQALPLAHLKLLELPPDLLNRVFIYAIIEYLDELIAGKLKYSPSSDSSVDYVDPALSEYNVVVSLLQTCKALRTATITVLSEALDIPYESSGICR